MSKEETRQKVADMIRKFVLSSTEGWCDVLIGTSQEASDMTAVMRSYADLLDTADSIEAPNAR